MKHKHWVRRFVLIAVMATATGCSVGMSIGYGNTQESPERKARGTPSPVSDFTESAAWVMTADQSLLRYSTAPA